MGCLSAEFTENVFECKGSTKSAEVAPKYLG